MRAFRKMSLDTPDEDLRFLRSLVRLLLNEGRNQLKIVEVGSWAGRTALNFVMDEPDRVKVWCVDTWKGSEGDITGELVKHHYTTSDVQQAFIDNVGDHLGKSIFACAGSSRSWSDAWPFEVDLVFIDACHKYEAVRDDIENWSRHVRPLGILCGHDYAVYDGVTRAADEEGIDGVGGRCVWWKRVHLTGGVPCQQSQRCNQTPLAPSSR